MNRRTALTFALLAGCSPAAEPDAAALRAKLDPVFATTKAPGAMLAVYRPGKPPIELAFGVADAGKGTPFAPDLHVRVASLSKVFVGTALLTLVDEGKVSVNDPVSKYLPGVPNGDRITIRHVAHHRSGLFNPFESEEVRLKFSADTVRWWPEDELLGLTLRVPAAFPAGEKYQYSNANTLVLARVIEKVTGRPWRDEVAARVFKPLGLDHTSAPSDNSLPESSARGYFLGGKDGPLFARGDVRSDVTAVTPSWWGPAGVVVSTVADLGKAAKPLATGALLKEKGKAALLDWTPRNHPGYEYGFHIERAKGMIGHEGDTVGYQSAMYYLPGPDATVVAVANLCGWSVKAMPANQLMFAALDHLSKTQ
jgi:D-alanyl-D-alanine carboxypeptidase